MAHHHDCHAYAAVRNAASRHFAAAIGFDNCSPTAWLAPLIAFTIIVTGAIVRSARYRRSQRQAANKKPRGRLTWTFEKAVMLLFCVPKIISLYSSITGVKEEVASEMVANFNLGGPSFYWIVAYIAILELLDFKAMKSAKARYSKSLLAVEQTDAVPYTDEKAPLLEPEKEEDSYMNQKISIYEAASMPLPECVKTQTETVTPPTTERKRCQHDSVREQFVCMRQRLDRIRAKLDRKYVSNGRAANATSIVASYDFSIFLRSLMLYTTLSVAALSLCAASPVNYFNVTECGFIKWMFVAFIYGFRITQLSAGKARFMVRESLRSLMEQGVRLV